ncbi:UNVERIFIED_CONTAM: hypothetical protein FKN15_030683 [Acipenser sinensis]
MKSTEVEQELFTDSYCKVCSAQLISESQRVAHYESRKHANKVRLFYMLHPVDGGCPAKRLRTDNGSEDGDVDKNKCCTLCNMSFTSAVVAQSHYQGKIHAKRLKLLLGEQPAIRKALKRSYTCDVCSVTLNSVDQYHAHLQGSKHQNKDGKILAGDLKHNRKKETLMYRNVFNESCIEKSTFYGNGKTALMKDRTQCPWDYIELLGLLIP